MDRSDLLFWIPAILAAGLAIAGRSPWAAWGPGIHIQLGFGLLKRLRQMARPSPEQKLAIQHAEHFYYGNIAADIINFKNYGGFKNHCHNWNIQERLQSAITSDTERAFLLGYLCHLAADVTAHNHFVPYHLLSNLPPAILGHPYWEALADGTVADDDWQMLAALKRNRALHGNDRLVYRAVQRKALGRRSNKWIFNNITLISLRRAWRTIVRKAHQREMRFPLHAGLFKACLEQCAEDMFKVFDADQLLILKLYDPTGRTALKGALRMRRELRQNHPEPADARHRSAELARSVFGGFFFERKEGAAPE